jgi:hypothetical protein
MRLATRRDSGWATGAAVVEFADPAAAAAAHAALHGRVVDGIPLAVKAANE